VQQRPVHLRKRGRGKRLLVELRVEGGQGRTEFGLHDGRRLLRGEGLGAGMQAPQRLGVLKRDTVRSQRKHLTRLDEGRAEPFQR